MKQIVTILTVFLILVFDGKTQVCPPKKSVNNNEPDTTSGYFSVPDSQPPVDLNNLEGLVKKQSARVIQLGYGINSILEMKGRQNDLSWFNDRPGHTFDFSVGLGQCSEWLLGFSFGFQKLGEVNRHAVYLPGDYSGQEIDFGTLPLNVDFELKASMYNPLVYTEYRFLKPWKRFSVFGRAEMGMTIYKAYSQLKYRDSCDCEKIPVSEWEMSTAFAAGLGLGVKWEYKFFGVKGLLSYQMQTKVNFKARNEYERYSFEFDLVHYDFKGGPESDRFAIRKSGEDVRRRYNPLYLQVMIYFRFGSR